MAKQTGAERARRRMMSWSVHLTVIMPMKGTALCLTVALYRADARLILVRIGAEQNRQCKEPRMSAHEALNITYGHIKNILKHNHHQYVQGQDTQHTKVKIRFNTRGH